MNFLSSTAKGEWMLLWNDDAYMEKVEWYDTFAESASLSSPLEEPVVYNIWGQGNPQNLFPIISKKFYEIVGHWSESTICDSWVKHISYKANIQRYIFGIKPHHRKSGHDNQALGDLIDNVFYSIKKLEAKTGDRYLGQRKQENMIKKESDTFRVIDWIRNSTDRNVRVGFIGLGKLGSPLLAALAYKGFNVVGVDINKKIVDEINKGKTSLKEPLLPEFLKKYKKRVSAISIVKKAIRHTDITFIVTSTPSNKNGFFSLRYVSPVVKSIAKELGEKKNYHLVVLVSTVMPGSSETIKEILERESGKICGMDFGLCYNPEFIALGNVINNLLNPDFILIGESDKRSGDILEKFYQKFCDNKPAFARMNFVNAEITKISLNTYVTTKISYANMLAELCENIPEADVDAVTQALGLDSRIGLKYLKGGPAYGGPCFPRDNIAFISLANTLGVNARIAKATHKTNLWQTTRILKLIKRNSTKKSKIGIVGLSYKPDTDVIEKSQGLLLAIKLIANSSFKVYLHDPISIENAKKDLGNKVNYCRSLRECVEKSDLIVITTNWPEFRKINFKWFEKERKVLIDPWRIFISHTLPKTLKYIPMGIYRH